MEAIFRPYDIRGVEENGLNQEFIASFAMAFCETFSIKSLVIGHDARKKHKIFYDVLYSCVSKLGVHVVNVGLCSTEEVYFHTLRSTADAGIMLTASHNPLEYLGVKMVKKFCMPLNNEEYILLKNNTLKCLYSELFCKFIGTNVVYEEKSLYSNFLLTTLNGAYRNKAKLKVVVNFSNSANILLIPDIFNVIGIELIPINDIIGCFNYSAPNPTLDEAIRDMSDKILTTQADFGIAFDGDGDRCCFFSSDGKIIHACYIGALIADYYIAKSEETLIIHDTRVVFALNAFDPKYFIKSKAGHTNMKSAMQKYKADYGYENSGHYYFQELGGCDSGILAFLKVYEILQMNDGTSLHELVQKYQYDHFYSGEINFDHYEYDDIKNLLLNAFPHSVCDEYDGFTINASLWRLHLRKSNTEDIIRLYIESCEKTLYDQKIQEIKSILSVSGIFDRL